MFKKAIIFLVLLLAIPSLNFAEDEPDDRVARLSLIKGDVSIQRADDKDWIAASVNMPLQTGDYIYSPKGARTEVQFDNSGYIRLSENTDLGILNLSDKIIQMKIGAGRATLGANETHFEIDTANAAITPLSSGRYRIEVDDEGNTTLIVQKGKAEISTNAGSITITENQKIKIEGDESPEYEIASADKRDSWDEWNDKRDSVLASVKSREYVPARVSGIDDLDEHGRWIYAAEYGYVWTPTVVEVGWAPYRTGRWVWRDPWGWVWVSYEPWGWAPYHYGRWAFVPGIGWCWAPGERAVMWRWRPAHVRFVTGPAWVAWVPLGPGEIYYWRHTASAHVSVSINVNVANAVTVIHHDTFVRGVRVAAPLPPNPFKIGKIIAGPPLIVPTKASLAPLPAKVVPRYAVPSPKIINRAVVVKTPSPPAPRLFSDKIKDIKASKGMPVKAVTSAPQTQPAKKGVVKTMPVKTIQEPKEGTKPLKPKETKTPVVEKRERPEFKKDDGKVQIPERKKPVPQKGGEITPQPKKELKKKEDISEPKPRKKEGIKPKKELKKREYISEPKKEKKQDKVIKKKQEKDEDDIKKQPFKEQSKDLERGQRGKDKGPH
ncbi:MAG: FecR domain-containing protein [Nitrospirae bacterium]|nr:FecR domain-containing protein [Nitrospirota bacterium]